LGEAGIWIAVIVIGVLALGVREYARASGTFAARWEQVKITFLAGILILLGVTAAVLATLFVVTIILPEIWRPLLVVVGVFAVLVFLVFRRNRPTE
jgi:ethanolamine utilization microcompartment shell protein EutS